MVVLGGGAVSYERGNPVLKYFFLADQIMDELKLETVLLAALVPSDIVVPRTLILNPKASNLNPEP